MYLERDRYSHKLLFTGDSKTSGDTARSKFANGAQRIIFWSNLINQAASDNIAMMFKRTKDSTGRSHMEFGLKEKLALVTASTGGIGLAIAQTLAAEGATVVVNGRKDSSVEQAMDKIKKALPDAKLKSLASDNGTADGCAATIKAFPAIDILVNNLGIY